MSDYSGEPEQLSQFLTLKLSRLQGKLNAQASKILNASVGVTLNQWRIIAFTGGAKQITASKLIEFTDLDKGLVSRNVKSLIERGMIQATKHPSDSRQQILSLTSSGEAVFETALPIMQRRQAHLRDSLGEENLAFFKQAIYVLGKASEDSIFPQIRS